MMNEIIRIVILWWKCDGDDHMGIGKHPSEFTEKFLDVQFGDRKKDKMQFFRPITEGKLWSFFKFCCLVFCTKNDENREKSNLTTEKPLENPYDLNHFQKS